MEESLAWRYNGLQVGLTIGPMTDNMTDLKGNVMFTISLISNDDGVLVSTLSFIFAMITNGQMITCIGGANRDDVIIQFGSGKDHKPYT